MATNTNDNFQRNNGNYQKRNERTGHFMSINDDGKPFESVGKESDGREGPKS